MKETMHRVLTQAEAKHPIRRIGCFFVASGPMTSLLTLLGIGVGGSVFGNLSSAFSASSLMYGTVVVIGAVVGGFLGWFIGIFMPTEVNEGAWDPLASLEAKDLDQLQRLAQRVPEVQCWVRQALDAELTFRRRDLAAARRDERKWQASLDQHVADVKLNESTGRLKKTVNAQQQTEKPEK